MTDPVALSAELLRAVRYEEVTAGLESRLAGLDVGELEAGVASDESRLAFWLNVYNAVAQIALWEDPTWYDSRR
ncbi:hypothetical protein VB773_18110 [Haloarculaceae archaeon H-GB2-1]|nr:hypothetical protein [Haloarculaceae archaeon H-GB1-1]MEA5409301.1 hypothetical protein [Haloarculaceae archaeon H-GB2-1]